MFRKREVNRFPRVTALLSSTAVSQDDKKSSLKASRRRMEGPVKLQAQLLCVEVSSLPTPPPPARGTRRRSLLFPSPVPGGPTCVQGGDGLGSFGTISVRSPACTSLENSKLDFQDTHKVGLSFMTVFPGEECSFPQDRMSVYHRHPNTLSFPPRGSTFSGTMSASNCPTKINLG